MVNGIIAVMSLAITGLLAVIYKIRKDNNAYKEMGRAEAKDRCEGEKRLIHSAYAQKIKNLNDYIENINKPDSFTDISGL